MLKSIKKTILMRTISILITCFLFNVLSGQTIQGKLSKANMFQFNNFIYVYNVDEKLFSIEKYDYSLTLKGNYSRTLEKEVYVYDGFPLFNVTYSDSGINVFIQISKEKTLAMKNYDREVVELKLNENLKEIGYKKSMKSYGITNSQMRMPMFPNRYSSGGEYVKDYIDSKSPEYQELAYFGPNANISTMKPGTSFILANYKSNEKDEKYKGLCILKREGDKTTSIKTYPIPITKFKMFRLRRQTFFNFDTELVQIFDIS